MDESTDITDSAQVLYFIRAITDFICYEELLALGTLTGRTRGIDIFTNFQDKCREAGLNFVNLVSVCTYGAPSMRGKHEGFIVQIKNVLSDPDALISFLCILHQQNLCAKSTILSDTLQQVISIVNYIRANATRHRQFRNMLKLDDEVFSVDLPYHSKVRWLSQGQVLAKMLSLREQIIKFYEEQNGQYELLKDFYRNAAFLCHIMSKQNDLNISLLGKTKYIYDMWQKIQEFRKKLSFFKTLLLQKEISDENFPQLVKVIDEQEDSCESFEEYTAVIDTSTGEYNERFTDFENHDITLKLAFQPHLVDVSKGPKELKMELIKLSEDNILKSLFDTKKDPIEIWKNAIEYPRLRQHARKMLSCFSTTYCCESTFSYLTKIKTPLRSQMTDTQLEDQLKLKTSMLQPNIQMLSYKKQSQQSH